MDQENSAPEIGPQKKFAMIAGAFVDRDVTSLSCVSAERSDGWRVRSMAPLCEAAGVFLEKLLDIFGSCHIFGGSVVIADPAHRTVL